MQIYSPFNGVRRFRLLPVDQDRVALQQEFLEQIALVLLHLDDLLREHFTGCRARVVHVRIPELEHRLSSEPAVAD